MKFTATVVKNGTSLGTDNAHARVFLPAGPWDAALRPATSLLNAVKDLLPVPFTARVDSATLTFSNKALNGVTLMKGCESWGHFKTGDAKTLTLQGGNKFWIVPDNCTQADGCYSCNLDCLGCFYISANVAGNGVLVTGIGYGHNIPVKVHNGINSAMFRAKNQLGKFDSVSCSTSGCDFQHIIQAQSGSASFEVTGSARAAPSLHQPAAAPSQEAMFA